MGNLYVTADLHFMHKTAADHRGYLGNVDEHDQDIITYWNETVGKDDTVWVLGDLALTNPERIWHLVDQLNGTKHLIAGNHDKVWSGHRNAYTWQRRYLEHFATVQDFAVRKLSNGTYILLSHFPYPTAEPEIRIDEQWLETEVAGYFVSDYGRVLSPNGVILRSWAATGQYRYVSLGDEFKSSVHRLVCKAFHGPAPDGMEVAHINGKPWDNRAENLRWATHAENMADREIHGTARGGSSPGESNPKAKLTASAVAEIRNSNSSYTVLAEQYGVSKSTIADIKNGRTWLDRDGENQPAVAVADHTEEERFSQFRLRDEGKWLLHGHVHAEWWQRGKQVNVGLDAWKMRPVHMAVVEALIAEGPQGRQCPLTPKQARNAAILRDALHERTP